MKKIILILFIYFNTSQIPIYGDSYSFTYYVHLRSETSVCTIDVKSDAFNINVSELPVGSESSFVVLPNSDGVNCSCSEQSLETMSCNCAKIPNFQVSCTKDYTPATMVVKTSPITLTSNEKTLTIDNITLSAIENNEIMTIPAGTYPMEIDQDGYNFYVGAKFNFPSNLDDSTTYNWSGTISSAVTFTF